MHVSEAIEKRRSIRKYLDKPVSDDLIHELMKAARDAPSGNNAQPWHFYAVKRGEITKKLKDEKIFYQDFVCEAPLIIVCSGDPGAYTKHYEGWDNTSEHRALRDVSIASSVLVLKATELGLATCYVGWLKKEEIKPLLDIPKNYVIPYVIVVGYADEKGKERQRKALDEISKIIE